MGSPAIGVVFLDGVAAIVKDLVEFIQVRSLFETHITNWRKKNAEDVAKHRQAEAEVMAYVRQRPTTANPAEREWPLWRIHSSDFSSSELVPIPRELYDKVQNLRVDNRYHLLLALDDEREWTLTEGFTMLAEIHDAAFEEDRIGFTDDFLCGVAGAVKKLNRGISQIAVERLATLVEKCLNRIALQIDAQARNEAGETLHQAIQRCRKKLEESVALSRQQFIMGSDKKTVQDEVSKLRSDLNKSNEELARRLVRQIQIDAEKQRQQQTEAYGKRGKRRVLKKRPAHRPRDTDAKDDAKIGDAWLRGRNSREFRKYEDLARALGRDETQIREAIDRDRHRRPEVWLAKRRHPRRKKPVKPA